MSKIHLLFSLLLLFFLGHNFYAQADFREGFILTNHKDTIYGEIDYRSDTKLYNECIFRYDNKTSIYSPSQITAYGFINDRVFISGIVVDQFVEVLVDGELSCYMHNYAYYIRNYEGEIFILEKKENIIEVENVKYLRRDDRWKRILYLLVYDCLKDPNILQDLNYSERNITGTVIEYNRCRGSDFFSYKENRPWTEINVGIGFGLAVSNLSVTNNQSIFFEDSYYSYDPSFGIIFNIASPRIFDRLSFQTEIKYLKTDFFSSVLINENNSYSYYDTYIYFNSVSLPFSAKFNVVDKVISFFVQGGLNLNFLFNTGSSVIEESILNNVVSTSEYQAFEIQENQVGIFGGIELQKAVKSIKIGLNLRYNHFFNLNSIENQKIRYDLLSLSVILYRK